MAHVCTAHVSGADWAAPTALKPSLGRNVSAVPQLGKASEIHPWVLLLAQYGGLGGVWTAAVSISHILAN